MGTLKDKTVQVARDYDVDKCLVEKKCQKLACDIQYCLAQRNYQREKCKDYVDRWENCCRALTPLAGNMRNHQTKTES